MAIRIAFFKNTGEVTTPGFIFHLSSLLSQGGHTVLMVDADPQCNLTSLVLQSYRESGLDEFYKYEPARNIYAGLSPIFKQDYDSIFPIECFPITSRNDLFLLPGNVRIIEYEESIKQCLEPQETAQSAFSRAWALSNLIDVTAGHHNADLVLIDVGANTCSFNRDILMTSDYFMIVSAPGLSGIAIDMIPSVFAHWHTWHERSKDIEATRSSNYPRINSLPKFLGMIIQELCPRDSVHEAGKQNGIEVISQKVKNHLIPALRNLDMIVPDARYEDVIGLFPNLFTDQLPEISHRISKVKEYDHILG